MRGVRCRAQGARHPRQAGRRDQVHDGRLRVLRPHSVPLGVPGCAVGVPALGPGHGRHEGPGVRLLPGQVQDRQRQLPLADHQREQGPVRPVFRRHHDQHPPARPGGQRARRHHAPLHEPGLGHIHPRRTGHLGRALRHGASRAHHTGGLYQPWLRPGDGVQQARRVPGTGQAHHLRPGREEAARQARHQAVPDTADEQGQDHEEPQQGLPVQPRPRGKSCDEYPFATTWQGASTGSGKFSWRMIDAKQNSQGGNALNNFYTYNRIIEKDRFLVWIK
ncbi:NucA/NucB deoxyribonuclease domain-containing protein [Streptomyces nogalater]